MVTYALPVVPAKAWLKLSGLSTCRWPPRATNPDTTIKSRIRSLIIPRKFCSLNPQFKASPWIRKAQVTQTNPIPLWFQPFTGWLAALRIYSPKITEFEPAHPRRTTYPAYIAVTKNFGLR